MRPAYGGKEIFGVHTEPTLQSHVCTEVSRKVAHMETRNPSLKSLLSCLPCVMKTAVWMPGSPPISQHRYLGWISAKQIMYDLSELSKSSRNTKTNCLTQKIKSHWAQTRIKLTRGFKELLKCL